MTPRPPPTAQMSPDDAAAYWLARCDAEPAAATSSAFLAWRDASPANAAAWARAEIVWRQAAEDLQDDPLAEALRASALAARPPVWPKALAQAAAVLVVLLAAAGGWRYWSGKDDPAAGVGAVASRPAAGLQYATRTGERRDVTLPDGTRLDLDSGTFVQVAFDDHARRVTLLKGRTYVRVAHDAARPFALQVGDQTIVDRGTEFSVRIDPGRIMVVLAQGEVAVGGKDEAPRAMAPGQRLILRAGRPAELDAVDLETVLAWREGFIEFSDTPLADAVAELNRYGGPTLVVADPRAGALKVSGRFKLGEPERFLRTVSALLPLETAQVGETIEIREAPSEAPR